MQDRPKFTPFSFLAHALKFEGSVAPLIAGRVLAFGLWAFVMALIHKSKYFPSLNITLAPYELAGAALGLLMVTRSNAGYERWWEGRKLWGDMLNSTRSLAVQAATYGPNDPAWRSRVARRIIVFAHVCRRSLRDERTMPEVLNLLGPEETEILAKADHMPTLASVELARELRTGLSDFPFLSAEQLRCKLIDDIGGCERIVNAPLPLAYAVEVRRFLFVFLSTMPFVLFNEIPKDQAVWAVPLVVILAAYPFLAIEKIGHELQFPFATHRLNHLPLDEITSKIERNVLAILEPAEAPARLAS